MPSYGLVFEVINFRVRQPGATSLLVPANLAMIDLPELHPSGLNVPQTMCLPELIPTHAGSSQASSSPRAGLAPVPPRSEQNLD